MLQLGEFFKLVFPLDVIPMEKRSLNEFVLHRRMKKNVEEPNKSLFVMSRDFELT